MISSYFLQNGFSGLKSFRGFGKTRPCPGALHFLARSPGAVNPLGPRLVIENRLLFINSPCMIPSFHG